jgi:hypothetical protein
MVRLAYLVIAFSSIVLVPSAPAQTHGDLFDKKSNRTGGVIIDERTGRVDVYDRDSNRLGYGSSTARLAAWTSMTSGATSSGALRSIQKAERSGRIDNSAW